jgi:DNA-binding CsgD family transcriptional regulator
LSYTISSSDLGRIQRAQRVLLAPAQHASLGAWLAAAAKAVVRVMRADHAHAFVAPAGAAPTQAGYALDPAFHRHAAAFFAQQHDDAQVRRGLALHAEMQAARRRGGAGVYHELVLAERARIEASPFFQEVCAPHGIRYTTGLSVPWCGGEAALCVAFDRPDAAGYAPQASLLLGLLLPAFEGGLRYAANLGGMARAEMGDLLDVLREPVALFGARGCERHRNRALCDLLQAEPDADGLMRAATEMACAARHLASRACSADARPEGRAPWSPCRKVEGAAGTYRLRAVLVSPPSPNAPGVLVTIERRSPLPSASAIEQRHGLTPREAEVARLVARGASNAALAERLHISEHTARHHVASILGKLGLSSRAAVACVLLGGEAVG